MKVLPTIDEHCSFFANYLSLWRRNLTLLHFCLVRNFSERMTANWKVELSNYWKIIECETRNALNLVKEHLRSDGLSLNKNFIDYFTQGANTR